jgi:hypothetical protein
MSNSGGFGAIISALTAAGQSNIIPTVVSALGSLNSTSSQVNAQLNQLAVLCNNPAAYAASAPTIITKLETIPGIPASVLPLLETLRAPSSMLMVAQTIQAIEAEVSAQTNIL